MEREHCAQLSRDLGEPLAGTAPEATGWIAVEHPGPWTARAPTAAELGAVAAHLDVDGVRTQLIRPVQHQHLPLPQPHGHTVLLAHAAVRPQERWVERLRLDRIRALGDLDPSVALSADAPGLGEPIDHDVWLVCTHSRRDACCALRGRAVATVLEAAGVEVWETTHTGGHRFAATAVVLPDGLSLGRLDSVDVAGTARALAAGRLEPDLLRGRCAVPRPAQAAEAALRGRLDRHGRDEVLPEGVLEEDGDVATVAVTTDGQRWVARVRGAPADPPRPVSDGADPTRPERWAVTDLTSAST